MSRFCVRPALIVALLFAPLGLSAQSANPISQALRSAWTESVLGSMYTRYKTPMLTNLTFDQVTFTPKLLLKDMDLGLSAARAYGVAMPTAAATRESVARMVGRGYDDIDFAVLLVETAKDAGLELKPDNVKMSDGLEG